MSNEVSVPMMQYRIRYGSGECYNADYPPIVYHYLSSDDLEYAMARLKDCRERRDAVLEQRTVTNWVPVHCNEKSQPATERPALAPGPYRSVAGIWKRLNDSTYSMRCGKCFWVLSRNGPTGAQDSTGYWNITLDFPDNEGWEHDISGNFPGLIFDTLGEAMQAAEQLAAQVQRGDTT